MYLYDHDFEDNPWKTNFKLNLINKCQLAPWYQLHEASRNVLKCLLQLVKSFLRQKYGLVVRKWGK